eukprot:291324_1
MSNDNTITKELSLMGFGRNYIDRALIISRKRYGTKYNVSVLTELIIRLQHKDNAKRHSEPYTHSNKIHHILPPLPLPLPSKSNAIQLKSKLNPLANPIPISRSLRKRHSAIITSLPAQTLKLFKHNQQPKHRTYHPHTKRKTEKHIKPILIDEDSAQTVIIHDHDTRPTISDDISELHTPPLPTHSSNNPINGRDFKRIMIPDPPSTQSLSHVPSLRYSSRDRMSSEDTENKKAMRGLRLSLNAYSLSSSPTHNSECHDVNINTSGDLNDVLNEDVFQQQSKRILIQNRKRYSLQPRSKPIAKQCIPKRKSESTRTYNTLDVPLFKELETTFGAFNRRVTDAQSPPRPRLKHSHKPRRRSIRIQQARNGIIKVFEPKTQPNRRKSDPTSNGVWNGDNNEFSLKHMQHIKKRCNVMNDEQIIDKIIGKKEYKLWDLNNDRVDLYRDQCSKAYYHELVPSLYDVMYPIALSSIALPPSLCSTKDRYKVNVFLDVETFTNSKVEMSETYRNKTHFTFDLHTTTQDMIDGLLDDIKRDLHIHKTTLVEWDTLHSMCFMLKVDGRQEFLKYDGNHKVIQSRYVRECIRNGETKRLQFILIYVSGLFKYNDAEYRADLAANARPMNDVLPYENMGFNVLFKALQQGNNDVSFDMFSECIQQEVDWVSNKVGHVKAKS